jgi:hypothetical protein
MRPRTNRLEDAGFTRRDGLIALLGGVAALAGCGGGGGDGVASVGSGGTGSFSSGVIAGFGSIIVNGVRFDDSQATITDDDGARRSSADLKLGMVVAITGSGVTAGATGSTATASSINFGSELRGPIDSVAAQSLVVLGQTVQVRATTIFDSIAGGLAGLAAGQLVEVHGFVDPASNQIIATRIEREDNADTFKLQGQVQSLNTTARTFSIGALSISYAGIAAADLPANLANGLLVRVRLAPTPATGTRTATRVRGAGRNLEDRDEAEVEGTVTSFTSNASFSVNGVTVDAANATFTRGTTGLRVGARIEVKGRVVNGVLVAATVKLEDDNELDREEFELHGTVSNLDTAARTFVVRGVTVSYAGNVRFDNGSAANLASLNGVAPSVEVKGSFNAATNSVAATRIEFEG